MQRWFVLCVDKSLEVRLGPRRNDVEIESWATSAMEYFGEAPDDDEFDIVVGK